MEKCICEVKDQEEKLISKGHYVDLYINRDRDEYYILAISDGRAGIQINYCPKCGRKLSEE